VSPITRRRFLALGTVAVVGAAAGTAYVKRGALKRWAAYAPPDHSPTGPLSARADAVMRSAVTALLGEPIDPARYLERLNWRAENLRGHRAMVERFVVRLDAAARRAGADGFEALRRDAQRRILHTVRPVRGWRRAVRGVLQHERARDSEQVVRSILAHFASTDGWVRIGYEAWPGVPRAIAVTGGPKS
jgi:hypothetical protein